MARPKIDTERREQILQAFEICVIRYGIAKTTLQRVADESALPRSLVRYFVGNRDNMVTLLIERIIERAELGFANLQPQKDEINLEQMVDHLFDEVFANDTTNQIVDQLWQLASQDDEISKALKSMYNHAQKLLTQQMTSEQRGKDLTERRSVAYALLSLAYGDSSFRYLGLKPARLGTTKKLAQSLLTTLD